MPLLLCAATEAEILPTLAVIEQLGAQKVEVLVTGVGLMAATYSITEAALRLRPRVVVQAGVAGSFCPQHQPGFVGAVCADRVGDEGVWEPNFKDVAALGLRKDGSPWKQGWLPAPHPLLGSLRLPQVRGITVNTITTREQSIEYYKQLGAEVESMEGAALHYVCLQLKLPFVQLRAVSNAVGERNKEAWNLPLAITSLNIELQRVINILLHAKN